jgi:hypothetical protein
VTGAYSFLPWLRTGLATRIPDEKPTGVRAKVPVFLRLTGEPFEPNGEPPSRLVEQHVQIYGPGDILAIERPAVSRTEPRPYISNFEPNYLAHIEFYEEDYPWRYSPAPRDGATKRLPPWLALIVLESGEQPEFIDGTVSDRPQPYITVTNPAALQPANELGAWAHVHVNGELDTLLAIDDPKDMGPALSNLGRVLREAPDSACSRVICPRHLRPSTQYDAFLVPAFEAGRRAGLGMTGAEIAAGITAVDPAWTPTGIPDPVSGQLPYYYRWSFTTSTAGDFEYLVRLLDPIEAAEPVGRRDMDAHRSPGFGLDGITTTTLPDGVLRLGGALQLPDFDDPPVDDHENWDNYYEQRPAPAPQYPVQWQKDLAGLINLATEYQHTTPAAANSKLAPRVTGLSAQTDPVITPPLYGRWHALTPQLLTDDKGNPVPDAELRGWVHRLNLDPRFRVAAQFGTQVIQMRQEELMASAWKQLGDARLANAGIRIAQLAREVGNILLARNFPPAQPATAAAAEEPPLASARSLTLSAPAHPRVVESVSQARARTVGEEAGEQLAVGFKVARSLIASAPVSPPMRRITRPRSRLMRRLDFTDQPPEKLVSRIDEGEIFAARPLTTPVGLATPAKLVAALPSSDDPTLPPPNPIIDAPNLLPPNPIFELRALGEAQPPAQTVPDTEDSAEARAYKSALGRLSEGLAQAAAAADPADREPLGVTAATDDMMAGLDAEATVLAALFGRLNVPQRVRSAAAGLTEVMAYPVFDMPMYKDLLAKSVDTFVPNLGLLPPNSITLLESNRRFIESYLVGLNHELAREMLWREYPTDLRGTPFRQFWDPRPALSEEDETADERKQRLYDIKPIHEWPKTALLGENDNRPPPPPGEEHEPDLVLVIRGELLKKYPTAAIYAHKAVWPVDDKGNVDMSGERVLADVPEGVKPPRHLIRMPLYEAKVEPDIYLLGFDLGADTARDGGDDGLGWFFVIKERPGDPRFGLDEDPPEGSPEVEVWNDLTWGWVDPQNKRFIRFDATRRVTLDKLELPADQEKIEQREDDDHLKEWSSTVSSADVAYILFQAPVLVAVHAMEMLPDDEPES